jgi:excisionase family DNA binding protein
MKNLTAIQRIEKSISELSEKLETSAAELLTAENAADYLGIKKSYLHKLVHFKKLSYSKPANGYIYFLKSDLNSYMLKNRCKSGAEIEGEADKYLRKTKQV